MKIEPLKLDGGYKFENFQGQPAGTLTEIPAPEVAYVPLNQGFGLEQPPVVQAGEQVVAGQIVGRDDDVIGSPVHAPVTGEVEGVERIEEAGRSGRFVEIKSNGNEEFSSLAAASTGGELQAAKLRELIYLSGASSLPAGGFPTGFRSSVLTVDEFDDLVIRGPGARVYNCSSALLLADERKQEFVEALQILKGAYPDLNLHLVFDRSDAALLEQLGGKLDGKRLNFYTKSSKYPHDHEQLLFSSVLNREVPLGYPAYTAGALAIDVPDTLQLRKAVAEGRPVLERIGFVAGPGFESPAHVRFRVGTPVENILEEHGVAGDEVRLVENSPLTGPEINDSSLPCDRTSRGLVGLEAGPGESFLPFLVPGIDRDSFSNTFLTSITGGPRQSSARLQGEERPCVKCNYCYSVCPVDIIPHLVYQHVEADEIGGRLVDYNIHSCIGCGLCDYVCPSKISLSDTIAEGREELSELELGPETTVESLEQVRGLQRLEELRQHRAEESKG